MRRGLFITATDTGAGKTALACALIRALEAKQLNLCIRKPVESGCLRTAPRTAGALHPRDAAALAEASRTKPPLESVCPYRLEHSASPAYAAQLEAVTFNLTDLTDACRAQADEYLLVEGAGGFYSPIAEDGLNADLAQALELPMLLVVADQLGCIGHALLTIEAARRRKLDIAAIAMNQNKEPEANSDTDNGKELSQLTRIPIIETAFGEVRTATGSDKINQIVALVT